SVRATRRGRRALFELPHALLEHVEVALALVQQLEQPLALVQQGTLLQERHPGPVRAPGAPGPAEREAAEQGRQQPQHRPHAGGPESSCHGCASLWDTAYAGMPSLATPSPPRSASALAWEHRHGVCPVWDRQDMGYNFMPMAVTLCAQCGDGEPH